MTPFECSMDDEVFNIELYDQDGNWCNGIRATVCAANWLQENYSEILVYPGVTAITWAIRVPPVDPPPEPEDPPVDPDPDEGP